jgi:hypothetical protein
MVKTYSQIFEMKSGILYYDSDKSILLCKEPKGEKNRWVKKINDTLHIDLIIEDSLRYYMSCESGETRGYLLAISQSTGATEWFIPGKPYFQILYDDYLHVIFADEQKNFYLLKVEPSDGTKIWHRRIDEDLCQYSFRSDRILLTYESGKTEQVSPLTGSII